MCEGNKNWSMHAKLIAGRIAAIIQCKVKRKNKSLPLKLHLILTLTLAFEDCF